MVCLFASPLAPPFPGKPFLFVINQIL